jgi:hypothetical protein
MDQYFLLSYLLADRPMLRLHGSPFPNLLSFRSSHEKVGLLDPHGGREQRMNNIFRCVSSCSHGLQAW